MIAFSIHRRLIAALFVIALSISGPAPADSWRLNPPLVSGGRAVIARISPDGTRVVYRAIQDTPDAWELYSVPIEGGTAVRLNGALPSGTEVGPDWTITPDSSRVVFTAPQETMGVRELYSVPIDGPATEAIKLNKPLVVGGAVTASDPTAEAFELSPDGSRVVYMADQGTDEVTVFTSTTTGRLRCGAEPDTEKHRRKGVGI